MQDKEFVRYGITPTDGAIPDGVKYFEQQEAVNPKTIPEELKQKMSN